MPLPKYFPLVLILLGTEFVFLSLLIDLDEREESVGYGITLDFLNEEIVGSINLFTLSWAVHTHETYIFLEDSNIDEYDNIYF